MSVKQSFLLAIKALAASKMRALLTMLGIIIGVAAVIVIISLGDGMTGMMNDQFNKLGANLIQVSVWGRGSSRNITPEDMYELVEDNPEYLTSMSPYVQIPGTVKCGNESYTPNSLLGGSEDYMSIRSLSIAEGRFLQYIDVARLQNVCIIGAYNNTEYFNGQGLGKDLSISGHRYTVVGVLEAANEAKKGTDDDIVLIPYINATRLIGNDVISLYLFSGASKDTATQARALIENRLFETYQDKDTYMVMTSAEMMDAMNTMMNTMMTLLVAIAGISLLVGGIGIMNIMLVSVTERTREIGIRKSLGAKRKDIRRQFIIEAGTTSAIGGIIGIGLGALLSNAAGMLIATMVQGSEGFSATPSLTAIGVAFGVSVGVGVLFGYLPANKASGLNPIDALRYD